MPHARIALAVHASGLGSEDTMAGHMQVVHGEGQRRDESATLRMLAVTCAILTFLLLVGTFFDLPISQAVAVAEGNPFVTIVSTLGLLPGMFPLCVMAGACARRLWSDIKATKAARTARVTKATRAARTATSGSAARVAGLCGCIALVLAAGVIGFVELFDVDGLGPILPFAVPRVHGVVGGIACGLAFGAIGYRGARDNADPALVRRLALVITAIVAVFALSTLIKGAMCRPRFRLLRQNIPGIEYLPWYRRNVGGAQVAAELGIERSDIRSFPSGHAIQCAFLVCAYYGLMAIFPRLRRGWRIVRLAYAPLLATIMACRILLAAHFLSDVATGGLMVAAATVLVLRSEVAIPAAPARAYLRQV